MRCKAFIAFFLVAIYAGVFVHMQLPHNHHAQACVELFTIQTPLCSECHHHHFPHNCEEQHIKEYAPRSFDLIQLLVLQTMQAVMIDALQLPPTPVLKNHSPFCDYTLLVPHEYCQEDIPSRAPPAV